MTLIRNDSQTISHTRQRCTFCGAPFSSLLFSTAERVSPSAAAAAAGRRAMRCRVVFC